MTEAAVFWDKAAEKYASKPVVDEEDYRDKLRMTQEFLTPDMNVLEVGCGTGSTAIVHAPFVKHIRATDVSPKMISIADRKAAANNVDNVTFEVLSFTELDVANESLDVVMAHSVLHFLEDTDAVLARFYSMLKKGGVLVTSTICLGDNMSFFKIVAPVGRFLGLIPLINVFTVQELASSFEKAGFTIEINWQPGKNKAAFIVGRKSDQFFTH